MLTATQPMKTLDAPDDREISVSAEQSLRPIIFEGLVSEDRIRSRLSNSAPFPAPVKRGTASTATPCALWRFERRPASPSIREMLHTIHSLGLQVFHNGMDKMNQCRGATPSDRHERTLPANYSPQAAPIAFNLKTPRRFAEAILS